MGTIVLPLQRAAVHDDERVTLIAEGLADAVDAKGRYAPSHSRAVGRLAAAIGLRLGVHRVGVRRLHLAGLLHDVGKLQIPDEILLKPDRLTPNEYEVIKAHPVYAHSTAIGLGLPDEARWILHHHERADGGGYPSGLVGDAIPLGARILLAADAWDVMRTKRTYSAVMSEADALVEMHSCVDTQFDRDVVHALTDVIALRHSIMGQITTPEHPAA